MKQWDAHILTKQHRTSVAREKALQMKSAKRGAEGSAEGNEAKRVRVEVAVEEDGEVDEVQAVGLPAGFFSAGNRPGIELDEEEAMDRDRLELALPGPSTSAPQAKTGDSELDDFLASLVDDNDNNKNELPTSEPIVTNPIPKTQKRSARAPGYRTLEVPGVASYEAAPIRIAPDTEQKAEDEEEEGGDEVVESAQERRERVAREEREEIMGRLEEEERAQ